ncbi:MAG: hypothetical protein ACRDNS_32410 [Trebonia sp.]
MRPSTHKRYREYVRAHTIRQIGRLRLVELMPMHLQALYASRLRTGSSASTVQHLHRRVCAVMLASSGRLRWVGAKSQTPVAAASNARAGRGEGRDRAGRHHRTAVLGRARRGWRDRPAADAHRARVAVRHRGRRADVRFAEPVFSAHGSMSRSRARTMVTSRISARASRRARPAPSSSAPDAVRDSARCHVPRPERSLSVKMTATSCPARPVSSAWRECHTIPSGLCWCRRVAWIARAARRVQG